MERSEYRRLYELEDELWWFRGMERISLSLLRRHAGKEQARDVLDAGCGTGGMLKTLARLGRAIGVDRSEEAVKFARRREGLRVLRADVEHLPFASESFDIVTSFDVLYHLDVGDDVGALREIARVLRPQALCLIRVPANDALRSRHDEAVHTRERYSKSELISKLERAGLTPEFVSFANCLLYPVAVLKRKTERFSRRTPEGSEVQAVGAGLNRLLTLPLIVESWLLKRVALPFGLSLVAIARKEGP